MLFTWFWEKWTRIHRFLQGQIQKARIIAESGEGHFHQVPRRRIAGRRGTGDNLGRQPRVSFHIEIRTLYAEAYLGNKIYLKAQHGQGDYQKGSWMTQGSAA